MPALEDKVSAIDASVGSKSASTSNATAAASTNDDIAINSVVNGVVVKGGWDELPHNMGTLATKPSDVAAEEQADTKPAKPRGKKLSPAKVIDDGNGDEGAADRAGNDSGDEAADMPAKPEPNKRAPRKKVATKEPTQNDDVDMEDALQEADGEVDAKPAPKKRAPRKRAAPKTAPVKVENAVEDEIVVSDGAADDFKADTEATPVAEPAPRKRAPPEKKAALAPVKTEVDVTPDKSNGEEAGSQDTAKLATITPARTPRKRAAAKKKGAQSDVKNEENATEGVDDGAIAIAPKTPKPRAPRKKAAQQPSPADSTADGDDAAPKNEEPKITSTRKRAKGEDGGESEFEEQKPKRKRASRTRKVDTGVGVVDEVKKIIQGTEVEAKVKKPKAARYGITPGVSPYPDWPLPTAEACYEVNKLLSDVHGMVEQPKTIPPPSLEITGCGEVPSVLDALIRTRLSAATTSTNSGYAFAGLVNKFGIMDSGIGKGSINWNKVREADETEIEEAIKRGGLAKTKSVSIKKILNMVHEQNLERREAFKKEKEEGIEAKVLGADSLPQGVKDLEIAAADEDVLTLQYMHGLTADEAMAEMTKFPGIGVKTASCVTLFCLRRPSFAVDTHVFRLCKWLKWIPANATRDKTFSHCEVRIPHELKYSLHQLFIRHGKTCGRCRAATGQSSEAWENANCPIEHLVTRDGARKIVKPEPKAKTPRKKKAMKVKGKDEEDTESELSEHDDEEFEDLLSGESDELPQSPDLDDEDEGNAFDAETETLGKNMEGAPEHATEGDVKQENIGDAPAYSPDDKAEAENLKQKQEQSQEALV